MSQCTRCLLDFAFHPALVGGLCPNCGLGATAAAEAEAESHAESEASAGAVPQGPGASLALFTRFWQTTWDVIIAPGPFFAKNAAALVSDDALSSALAFAVIVQWLAAFCNFIWRATFWTAFESKAEDLMRIAGDIVQPPPGSSESLGELRSRAIEFFFGAGAIVLAPFIALIKLVLITLLVHAAVRFFTKETADRPHSYSATLKILAYSSAPWVLCVIPGVGVIVAYILSFIAAVAGIREVYRTTTGRAVTVILFPELLFFAFILAIGVFFLFLAFGVYHLLS